MEEYLSVKEIAIILHISVQTVRNMVKKGAPIYGGRGRLSEVRKWQEQNSKFLKK